MVVDVYQKRLIPDPVAMAAGAADVLAASSCCRLPLYTLERAFSIFIVLHRHFGRRAELRSGLAGGNAGS
jgi:hypothetical protein